jgi:predicted transcriptional regulator
VYYLKYSKNKHRDRVDILASILGYIREVGDAKKTHILYATNLNTRSLEKFLEFLLRIKAIEKVRQDNSVRYRITEHGSKVLFLIRKLRNLLDNEMASTEFNEERLIRILKNLVEPLTGDTVKSIKRASITGRSGYKYNVLMVMGERENYILANISEEEEFCWGTSLLCRILVYVFDTDYKTILLVDGRASISGLRLHNLLRGVLEPFNATDRVLVVESQR